MRIRYHGAVRGATHRGLALSVLLAGCGLTLDYYPPDPQPGIDGGRMDAGRADAAGADGGLPDGGDEDAGPPLDCLEDVDCDDLDACTGLERCVEGACVPGEPIACPDDDVCDGVDACVDGECVSGPAMTCPMDANPCNGIEICDPAIGCTALPPVPCDDGIDCTRDTCDPFEGCLHEADATLCPPGPGRRCDPVRGGCQYDVCDASTCVPTGCVDAHCEEGVCMYTALCALGTTTCCAGTCAPLGCSDGNPCTTDSCDPAAGCVHTPISGTVTACDDGNPCTIGDTCRGDGTCGSGPLRPCSDGNPCTTDSCDPVIGCVNRPAPDDTACSDGNACTVNDVCLSGVCTAGPTRTCMVSSERRLCVSVRCDNALGCVEDPLPVGTSCSPSGDLCDGAGHCCGSYTDCDGDGICECPPMLTCGVAGGCPGFDCRFDTDCGSAQACCVSASGTTSGFCYSRSCPGCCTAIAAP